MHICFLSQEFPQKGSVYGGIGTFLSTISANLVKLGHEVTVIGVRVQPDLIDKYIDGVRVVTIPHSGLRYLAWWRNTRAIHRNLLAIHQLNPIDIIEGSELGLAFVEKNSMFKYVIRLHGGHHFFAEGENRKVNRWKGFQEKKSFRIADGFVAVSEYVNTHTGKMLSFHEKPVEVINYPIPLDKFYKADPAKVVKGRLVFAGTVCEKKGIRQLIGALPIVAEKYPEVSLEVYGRDWKFSDGKSYTKYLQESFPKQILDRITFHGPVAHDDLPGYYEQAEICVFPSHMETQGLVAPEAMAMGKPVIFSKQGPGPETIDHGINGWLCDPHSEQDIAKVIIEAFDQRERFAEIGEKAIEKVNSKFEPTLITQKNLAFYSKLLKG
ncbi:glycosyltransferase family 4 protein [Algoriphagus chordae]|uniref:Glycosyltransferase involved in cell wall biosynthesis n=1 Tax=Algoriphagus chordae TaxID=237019 RepID=A0A2W7QVI9_9BACT|nr:glycosyltransferase family 4 protein [Algoriphagus chordae]PZX47677.1 glycosyltransferase involved in cell wall biosynthesis [Algoriphagus chordae]